MWFLCKHPKDATLRSAILFVNPNGDRQISGEILAAITTERWIEMMSVKNDPEYWFGETANPFNKPTSDNRILKEFLFAHPDYASYFFETDFHDYFFNHQNHLKKDWLTNDPTMSALRMSLL